MNRDEIYDEIKTASEQMIDLLATYATKGDRPAELGYFNNAERVRDKAVQVRC